MNEPVNDTPLIEHLKRLDEAEVLSLVRALLEAGDDPLTIIQEAQEGMRLVGERYEQQQYYISGLMMAGEIFREVMELVEPVLVQQLSGNEAGHVLLATVQGDIHNIGKNIFKTMLRCYGFTVTDLGEDIPPDQIVAQAQAIQPDLIALSGLLTVSYDEMKITIERIRALHDKHIARIPVIIGGGLMNEVVCSYVGAEYWAGDAASALELCRDIIAEHRG